MSAYRVHQPLPLGVPPTLGHTARVYVDAPRPDAEGPLVVESDTPTFAAAVKARLRRCYGFRGRPIGEVLTQDDLHCAMSLRLMRELRPEREE